MPDDAAPQHQAVLAALQRLLAWPEISRSPQLGRFLDYIVRQTLAGDGQTIKAYAIAVDVFGRPADFDPQADPIVRVQARRLRALLDEYYSGPGADEPTRIQLPVGRYIPEFILADTDVDAAPATVAATSAASPRRRLPPSWFGLALGALLLSLGAYAHNAWVGRQAPAAVSGPARPTITVVEFQDLAGTARLRPQVAGLAIELVTDLEQFGNIEVRYGQGGAAAESDFVLTGIVRLDERVAQYSAILTESEAGNVVWNHTLAVPMQEAAGLDVLDRVSRVFSLMLGSPRGPLHAPARRLLAVDGAADVAPSPYLCRVLFDLYRESRGAGAAGRAGGCLEALGAAGADNAVVQAAMGSLIADGFAPVAVEEGEPDARLAAAETHIGAAVHLAPVSGFVWEQRARLYEAEGARRQARDAYSSAIQLNPANGDGLAGFALLLALGGELAEAEAPARQALEESDSPPGWYHGVPALIALRDGDFAAAGAHAEIYARADRELGPILAILAGQGAGDSAMVSRYLPQVLDVPAFRAKGVVPRLGERIGDLVLIETIRTALTRAGMPPAALVQAF
ncbi:hypothetical protein [Devosia sp.]|uniref:hypothetical protein n=1 Tax=Devosia sp. TaxID=1871048 RepID=UPI002AFE22CA|nr:hypothetical protein [Devosia sp.]